MKSLRELEDVLFGEYYQNNKSKKNKIQWFKALVKLSPTLCEKMKGPHGYSIKQKSMIMEYLMENGYVHFRPSKKDIKTAKSKEEEWGEPVRPEKTYEFENRDFGFGNKSTFYFYDLDSAKRFYMEIGFLDKNGNELS